MANEPRPANPTPAKVYAKIDRRGLLKHAALAAFVAPVVRSTMARAQTAPVRRLLTVFWPNGLNHVSAGPSGSETAWAFGEYFTNLEKHRADTIAFAGLSVGGVPYGTNTEYGHQSGGKGCLTCTPDLKTGKATGPSIDQLVSQQLFEQKLAPMRKAPIFGVGASRVPSYGPVFHESAGKVAPTETDPKLAYEATFANIVLGSGQDVTKLIARRKSILDVALQDCKAQLPALPAAGRDLLDYHCTRIRELEDSLAARGVTATKACAAPKASLDMVAALNAKDPNNYPILTDFYWKLLQVIFQCDLSRVASFTWGGTAARFNMPWVNPPVLASVDTGEKNVKDHHSHTHAGTRQTIGLFMAWYGQKMSQLLDLLKEKAPDGTRLLDSMLVHFTTEYGGGGPHYNGNLACFLFGSAGGTFKTGRLLAFKNDAKMHHAMMVSIIKAMGIKGVDQFGHPMGGSGPIPALFA
jgi:hypothetical protein